MPDEIRTEIVDYSAHYGDAFERLNCEWLDKYFRVEPIDREILSDPRSTIIDHGGAVLYLLQDDAVVGTVALKHQGHGIYKLTNMGITSRHQSRGLGRKLLCAALDRFSGLEGKMLYLESHSSLTRALMLYESAGFHHQPPPRPSDYERADVYMVYRGS